MGCGSAIRSCNRMTCRRCYNNTPQVFAAGATTQLFIDGGQSVSRGGGVTASLSNYQINLGGVYKLEADVSIRGSASGDVTVQALLDGVVLPCTIRPVTLGANVATNVHISTELDLESACRCSDGVLHNITFVIVSAGAGAGTVTNLCTGVRRIPNA